MTFRSLNIEHHVDGLVNLENTRRTIRRTQRTDVNRHALPRGVKQFVSIQEGGDAGFAFAREELQERREILRAHRLARESSMQEVEMRPRAIRMVAGWVEGKDGTSSAGRIYEVERGTEETGEGVGEGGPPGIGSRIGSD